MQMLQMWNDMRLKKITLFLLIMAWGVPVMSIETGFNQELREKFKKSIGYSTLLEQPPTEKVVVLDWEKVLSKITDGEGRHWVGKLYEPSLDRAGKGEIKARLETSNGVAIVKVTSIAGNWKQRLDHVIWVESLTNRAEINLKLKPGVADLYLIPKDSSDTAFVSFLYSGFHVDVSEWEDVDVGALALSLLKIMQDNSHPVAVNKPAPKFSLTTDKNKIKVGDTFSIKVKGLTTDWNTNWIYSPTEELLPDTVEFLEQDGDVLSFNALNKGSTRIQVTAMNKNNLLLTAESLDVVVE